MKVTINRKPLRVEEEKEGLGINWVYLSVSTIGYFLIFYVLDLAGAAFLGIHPFPFVKFIGVILSWFH